MHHLLWLTIALVLLTCSLLFIKSLLDLFLSTHYHLCLVGCILAVSAFLLVVETDLILDNLLCC